MSSSMLSKLVNLSITSALILSLSGCIIHVGKDSNSRKHKNNVSSVFGSLEVSEGKKVTDVSSVNGDVTLDNNVTALEVDSVNGDIEVADYVTVTSLETVNGDIETGHHFSASKGVETVNGSIEIGHSSNVEYDVETINGDIDLDNSNIMGNVITRNGSISLSNNTQISGDIKFEQKNRNSRKGKFSSPPVLKIEQGSIVKGDIILEREVELEIDDAELLKKVVYRFDQGEK